MQVAITLYPQLTALDAIGPYDVFQMIPDFDIVFVGAERGEIRTDFGRLGLTADARYDEVTAPDVVVVPGGIGTTNQLTGALPEWLQAVHPGTTFTTSVCTGSLVLGAAGLLTGLTATTHWAFTQHLAGFGAKPADQRVVEHLPERIVTAAGVSAGIDMAIRLIALLKDDVAAQAAQTLIEYDPQPPYAAGHPAKVTPAVMARVGEFSQAKFQGAM